MRLLFLNESGKPDQGGLSRSKRMSPGEFEG
jgi:hypothetical protein